MRAAITGGAGFLGSHLCERLVNFGHDLICLDNFLTSQKTNVAHLLERPNFELVCGIGGTPAMMVPMYGT